MRKMLVFSDWYEPGFKAGGPIRSSVYFVDALKRSYDIFVFTRNTDLNSSLPYEGIISDLWVQMEGYKIFYCSQSKLKMSLVSGTIRNIKPDIIYLNGMFSPYFSVLPLLFRKLATPATVMVIAPRGMLKKSALAYKEFKKKIFLSVFKLFDIYNNIVFQATNSKEILEVKEVIGKSANVVLLPNFTYRIPGRITSINKFPGSLRLIYAARIHPIKNLDFIIRILFKIKGNIELTIVGSIEDKDYWSRCHDLIQQLPFNIHVKIIGELSHQNVLLEIVNSHLMCLPSSGENFGHGIFESLALGRPVLISDQTPWLELENWGAGWDINLSRPDLFEEAINLFLNLNQQEFNNMSEKAWLLAKSFDSNTSLISEYQRMFNY